jgi:excisionase family DNA binding protein
MTNNPANWKNPARHTSAALPFLSICDVAECLNVTTRTVRRWIASGLLRVHRFGGTVRILEADFAAFLAAHRAT